jgi:hypothetical protein
MRHLDEVLSIMKAQSLYAKESKCEFSMIELLYLGHIISAQGVQVHREKIRAILDWLTPKNVTELRSFFGLCRYYRKFVQGFSQLEALLIDLTKHGAFIWIDEVLMQGGHPIVFKRRNLSQPERLYSIL